MSEPNESEKKDAPSDRGKKTAEGAVNRRDAERRRYAPAVKLYSEGRSLTEAAGQCGVRVAGLASFVSRHHRNLVEERFGNPKEFEVMRRFKPYLHEGQSRATHLKYRRAVEACSDIAYLEFNVQQIGRFFRLNGSALVQQLKAYYPELFKDRETLRRKLGIATRGPRQETAGVYSEALDMFRDTDLSLAQVAEKCNVSRCGFSRFMRCYHKDLVQAKEESRKADRLLLIDGTRDEGIGKFHKS